MERFSGMDILVKLPNAEIRKVFVVYDDDYYDAWNYFPDSRDLTRRGLGLKS